MADYIKFTLQPGQQSPEGSTSRCLPTGEIVFYGDNFPAEITGELMTQDEIEWFENDPIENAALRSALADMVDNLKFSQVDDHIDNTFSGLSVAQRASLKKLYKAVLCVGKLTS